jgi:hypothetical protein
MAARLMAYADLMDAVVQYSGNNPNQQSVQNTNRAASAAYLGLVRAHDWSFYKRVFSVPTHAGYSTGTVTYDHTGGGTCERQLTLAGGTWPTWAAYGYVQIAMKTYQVQKYFSATVIQLAENNNPGDDISDASEYSLYRDTYPLPLDFANCYNAVTQPSGVQLTYVPIAMWAYGRDYYLNASRPVAFTVTQDLVVPQRQAVRFWPAPNEAYSVLFTYKADLVHPSYRKVVDGSVTLTASSATVTGTGTKFESGMAGALLRVSRAGDPTLPTGIEGENPAYAEYVIDSVQSETSLTLQDTADGEPGPGEVFDLEPPRRRAVRHPRVPVPGVRAAVPAAGPDGGHAGRGHGVAAVPGPGQGRGQPVRRVEGVEPVVAPPDDLGRSHPPLLDELT